MRINVLCQCGWGLLSVPVAEVPKCCPVCGFTIFDDENDEEGT